MNDITFYPKTTVEINNLAKTIERGQLESYVRRLFNRWKKINPFYKYKTNFNYRLEVYQKSEWGNILCRLVAGHGHLKVKVYCGAYSDFLSIAEDNFDLLNDTVREYIQHNDQT